MRKVDAEAQQQMMGSRASSVASNERRGATKRCFVGRARAAGRAAQPAPPPKVSRVAGETGSTFNAGRIHTYKFDQGRERESGAAGDGEQKTSPRSDVWSHRVPLSHKYRNVVNLKPVNFGATATADGAPPSGSQTERTERKGDRDMKMPPADVKGEFGAASALTARGPPPGPAAAPATTPRAARPQAAARVRRRRPMGHPAAGAGRPGRRRCQRAEREDGRAGARHDSAGGRRGRVVRDGSSEAETPAEAIRMQGHALSNHETGEILAYPKARARARALPKHARRASIKTRRFAGFFLG